MLFAYSLQAASQTPDESILGRQSDEGLQTQEERKHALTVLLAAAQQARDAEPIKAARFLNRAARLQLRLNSSKDALIYYQSARAILNRNPDSITLIDTLNGMATVYGQLLKWNKAKEFIDEALETSHKNGSVAGEAEALLTLSEYLSFSSYQEKAISTARRSLELWQSISDKRGMARAWLLLSDFQIVQHNVIEATKSAEAALNISREFNLPDELAGAVISLGFIEYRKGAWQECLSFLSHAQTLIDEKSDPFKMGQISMGIAEAFMESGMPEAGLTKAGEAREFFVQAENARGVAAATWDMGRAHYLRGDHTSAITALEEAKEASEANEDWRLVALCHDYLGRTFVATGEPLRALQEFQVALGIFERLHQPREAARVRALMGRVYEQQGKFDRARQYLTSALQTFERLTDRVNQSAALYALGELELNLNNVDLAEKYLEDSINVTENIRRVSTSGDLMAAISATVHDRYESYIECLMRKHAQHPEQDFAVRAFETSELARARALAEFLRATQSNLAPGVDPQLAAQEKSIRQELRVTEDAKLNLMEKSYKKEELTAIDAELGTLEIQYKQVIDTIRSRYPAYEQITRPAALSLNEIQTRVLPNDETLLLEFSLGEKRSYLWAITRTGFSSYELPGRASIEQSAHGLYELLTVLQAKPGESFEAHQERKLQADANLSTEITSVSNLLLSPVAEKLGSKRLIIVADGALQYIPFQALTVPANGTSKQAITNEREQTPLLVDHEIVYEPSASALALVLAERAQRSPAPNSIAVFADPVFEADDQRVKSSGAVSPPVTDTFQTTKVKEALRDVGLSDGQIPALPASGDEARAIMAVAPPGTGLKAIGFDASRSAVYRLYLAQYRVVHFATHALVNYQHPELSGLVLSMFDENGKSQEGFLSLHDIYNLKLSADLVVLSACNTGLGKEVKGEGLIGLTRGFMYAGASGVTGSLWKVDDEPTGELMGHFYEGMFQRGMTPSAAMREAQLRMLHTKRWRAPYYWAAFVIQGQYDQRVAEGFASATTTALWVKTLGVLGAALFVTMFFVVMRRRRRIL